MLLHATKVFNVRPRLNTTLSAKCHTSEPCWNMPFKQSWSWDSLETASCAASEEFPNIFMEYRGSLQCSQDSSRSRARSVQFISPPSHLSKMHIKNTIYLLFHRVSSRNWPRFFIGYINFFSPWVYDTGIECIRQSVQLVQGEIYVVLVIALTLADHNSSAV
jgi:hypothetical protein